MARLPDARRRSIPVFLTAALCAIVLFQVTPDAQRRGGGGGRPAATSGGRGSGAHGGGYRPVHGPVAHYPVYPVPYYSGYYAAAFWWGWPSYGYPYAFDAAYAGEATARLLVTPKDTEVYVNGYLAGIVDDFDGQFQGLRLPPGGHTIELYREGHRPVRQEIHLSPGATYKIRHTMEPLAAGEAPPPRPAAPAASTPSARPPTPPGEQVPDQPPAATALAIRVQPAGSEILIDGEVWTGPGPADRLVVNVPPGRHAIEVRKDGYVTFSTSVTVTPGEARSVNVSLSRVDQR